MFFAPEGVERGGWDRALIMPGIGEGESEGGALDMTVCGVQGRERLSLGLRTFDGGTSFTHEEFWIDVLLRIYCLRG